ncbi:asparagine synthase (glutamine-hydrolyzing) [Maribacter sp. R77961]|uniref:asparagine synthase (glutamine-hydrolyzing) n=1 Tax=Maribacter sp. R77961 TaxID=3093871 RepID=UPI0037C549E2
MCGIYLTNIPFNREEVKIKLEKIQYRGPDHTGVSKVDNITLGHLRLSILDLDPRSNQPMNYEQYHITFNGEIYNYLDIKTELEKLGYYFKTTSDTEVLLMGFKHWGKALLPKLNGMFAFCIYNSETKKVFCARDRMGVKPFYYYWNRGEFEICSQLRPIAKGKELFEEAIPMYLETRYIPSPYSIYKNVYKLPPGKFMVIDTLNNNLKIEEYWNLERVLPSTLSYEDAKSNLHDLIRDAVKIRLQSDVPIGTFLSGGIDSSLVSAIAAEQSERKIKTFTIGFENPEYNESDVAEQFAQIIGSEHTTTMCTSKDILELIPKVFEVYDEPFADESALPSLLLNQVTKKHVTVALSGDGGDESFLGYNHFNRLQKYFPIYNFPLWFRKFISKTPAPSLLGVGSEAGINSLITKDADELIANTFLGAEAITENSNRNWLHSHYSDYKAWAKNPLQRAADLNIKLWLENDSNVKVDRASMAYSVEVRSPFLDYRIVEFARNLPIKYRYENGIGKLILRDILEEYIPRNIFSQPKKGFGVPLGHWIQKELKEEILDSLNDEFLTTIPYLDIKKFKKQLSSHMKGELNNQANIWKLYVLKKWFDIKKV